jgi:hypothetical protein
MIDDSVFSTFYKKAMSILSPDEVLQILPDANAYVASAFLNNSSATDDLLLIAEFYTMCW